MKTIFRAMIVVAVCATAAVAGPFAPGAGQPGSTAIHKDDAAFVAWATGHVNYLPGPYVDSVWMTPDNALGKAQGVSGTGDAAVHHVVSLGRGGQITLTFDKPIMNGDGYDFAVFENAFTNSSGLGFLELAWVEVSSDGENFFRFQNESLTSQPVPFVGGIVDPTNIHNLAGKYRESYGTPFDLAELAGTVGLDVNNVTHVRLVDIIGDGSALDSFGRVIYDPYPTTGSAGFDLDGVGVINQVPEPATLMLLFAGLPLLNRRRR